jgi:predicted metal-dependent hydrolase
MRKTTKIVRVIHGHPVLVNIKLEPRNNTRFSFTKSGLNVLLPAPFGKHQIEECISKAVQWLEEHARNQPGLLTSFETKAREQLLKPRPDTITAMDTLVHIRVEPGYRNAYYGEWKDNDILISTGANPDQATVNTMRTKMVSRLLAMRFGYPFEQRVQELNKTYFNKQIAKISFRYNKRVWGSCSGRDTLSFSTRAFLLPPKTRDYLIIHELAHLVHHNHSPAFWLEVARCMPDFDEHDRLLSSGDGSKFDF